MLTLTYFLPVRCLPVDHDVKPGATRTDQGQNRAYYSGLFKIIVSVL